jgi:hypothetical protein
MLMISVKIVYVRILYGLGKCNCPFSSITCENIICNHTCKIANCEVSIHIYRKIYSCRILNKQYKSIHLFYNNTIHYWWRLICKYYNCLYRFNVVFDFSYSAILVAFGCILLHLIMHSQITFRIALAERGICYIVPSLSFCLIHFIFFMA